MMLRRNRAAARVRAPASRPVEIVLSAEARRKFADFIMLLDTAERRSGVIRNERKKVKQSKIRDGLQSSGLFLFFAIAKKLFIKFSQRPKQFSRSSPTTATSSKIWLSILMVWIRTCI